MITMVRASQGWWWLNKEMHKHNTQAVMADGDRAIARDPVSLCVGKLSFGCMLAYETDSAIKMIQGGGYDHGQGSTHYTQALQDSLLIPFPILLPPFLTWGN